MSITVVVPCRKRAEYLTTVLESIKLQTAFSFIDQIIVSENSDDEQSELVCAKFPELNIKYVRQTSELTAVEHLHWIIGQSESTYTAMLHDDDWWYPTHLESALNAFSTEDIVCYFSNFIFAKNEINVAARFHYPTMISYFAKEISAFKPVCLCFEDVCSLCYFYTPFHMSSMVAKTSFLKQASNESLKLSKPWYADRILYPFLSLYGKLAINPQVLVSIRDHARNDAKTIDNIERYNSHLEGSIKILNLANSKGVDILDRWTRIKSTMSALEARDLFSLFHEYFGYENNSMFIEQEVSSENKLKSIAKLIVKRTFPYGIISRFNKNN